MTKEQLRTYYKANLENVKEKIKRTDLSPEQKRMLGYTEERIKDLEKCLADLDK